MKTCKVCQQSYDERQGIELGVCSMVCFNWLNEEIKRQEDKALDRLEAGITEAETDYDN